MPILGIIASSKLGVVPGDFESIATTTVGSGGAANVEFTSIPATFTHLQVRGIARNANAAANDLEGVLVQYNGDTASNYSWHSLRGDGSAASAIAGATQSHMYSGYSPTNGSTSNTFHAVIIDILDYANTSKYTTQRVLTGVETNNSANSQITFWSGSWRNTNAVSSIKLFSTGAHNFSQYTQFALYGIRSA
jgi:hypothetical protein